MTDCHRRAWTVTAGARPEAGNPDGPTMSKSELGPIIAQMRWGRIGWAEKASLNALRGGLWFFGSPREEGGVPPVRVPGRSRFSRRFQAKEPGIDPSRAFPGTGRRRPCPPGAGRGGIGNSGDVMDAWLEGMGACHRLFNKRHTTFPRRSAANSGACHSLASCLDSPPAGPGTSPGKLFFDFIQEVGPSGQAPP
jgi:hypothetical protein